MRHRPGSHLGRSFVFAFVSLALTGALLLPRISHAAPTPVKVLLVADGLSPQEDDLENHFIDLGWSVTRLKDYKVNGTTKFSGYDLIVLTETAPLVPSCGLNAIKGSGKPVLVFETFSFMYAYRLGLTTTALPTLADDDTVTAVREGYDDFTSRVGAEALVYQPHALVFGVAANRVKAGVTQIFQSGGCLPGATVLADYTKKIAVTGVTDTAKYTVDAWKLLDILTAQILPPPPRYGSLDEVAQGYMDSGLYDFILDVQSDLKANPQSWTFAEAEQEAWLLTSEWHLDELWDYVMAQLGDLFDVKSVIPPMHIALFSHPERPHGDPVLHPGFLPSSDTDREFWFMGQYWDTTGNVKRQPVSWSQYYSGTDLGLGMNGSLNGRSYYYMGDTGDLNPDTPLAYHMWSETGCGDASNPVDCNDMIVTSYGDGNPADGIDASPIFKTEIGGTRWKPLVIPGVHNAFSSQLHDPSAAVVFWTNRDSEPTYTVPTGVVETTLYRTISFHGGPGTVIQFPMLMLWYGTAIAPGANTGTPAIDSSDPTTRPTSWVGCSLNGIDFYACYKNTVGDAVPFSIDESPPIDATWPGGECPDPGAPARFVQVAAVNVTASDFASLCSGTSTPGGPSLCDFADSGGGLLLFGSGRPYRKSGLFVAFVAHNEIGKVDASTSKPIVHYWSGSGWSSNEQDSMSLTGTPCDNWKRPDYNLDANDTDHTYWSGCWPDGSDITPTTWDPLQVFGEISAWLIRSSVAGVPPKIVLLNNNTANGWVLAWKAPLDRPWDPHGDFAFLTPADTKTYGYGPYIIDAYSDKKYTGDDITLWHTISVWDGSINTPYGVYTGSEVISWP